MIRQQQEAIRELSVRRQAEQALRALNQRLEEEARRIAHALHDEAGQLLVSVYLAVDTLTAQLQSEPRERLIEIRARLEQVEAQLRQLSHELRPTILDDLGLKPAIEFLADGISKRTGRVVVVSGSTGGRHSGPIETAMYRIVQEALTNVTKHAQATEAVVHLERRPDALVCSIADDGRGFDARSRSGPMHKQGLGLIGMRERAASLGGMLSITSLTSGKQSRFSASRRCSGVAGRCYCAISCTRLLLTALIRSSARGWNRHRAMPTKGGPAMSSKRISVLSSVRSTGC